MHRYVDFVSKETPPIARCGVDEDLIGAVFRFPLPHGLDIIQARLSELERHGVPIFGVEELEDRVRYDAYGTEERRARVLSMATPTDLKNAHRTSVEMVSTYPVIRPSVWITKSDPKPKFRRPLNNYVDEDVYEHLIRTKSSVSVYWRLRNVFGVETFLDLEVEPSNYSKVRPVTPPPPVQLNGRPYMTEAEEEEADLLQEAEEAYGPKETELVQWQHETDEAFKRRLVSTKKAEEKLKAQSADAAQYIQKARGGDFNVFLDIKRRLALTRKDRTLFDKQLASLWKKAYTKDVYSNKDRHDGSQDGENPRHVDKQAEQGTHGQAEERRLQEEEARRLQEEEARRLQEEEVRRLQEEEVRRLQEEEEKRLREEEEKRLREDEEQRMQEDEAQRMQEDEAQRMPEERRSEDIGAEQEADGLSKMAMTDQTEGVPPPCNSPLPPPFSPVGRNSTRPSRSPSLYSLNLVSPFSSPESPPPPPRWPVITPPPVLSIASCIVSSIASCIVSSTVSCIAIRVTFIKFSVASSIPSIAFSIALSLTSTSSWSSNEVGSSLSFLPFGPSSISIPFSRSCWFKL
jgi:hypothetical protein